MTNEGEKYSERKFGSILYKNKTKLKKSSEKI